MRNGPWLGKSGILACEPRSSRTESWKAEPFCRPRFSNPLIQRPEAAWKRHVWVGSLGLQTISSWSSLPPTHPTTTHSQLKKTLCTKDVCSKSIKSFCIYRAPYFKRGVKKNASPKLQGEVFCSNRGQIQIHDSGNV